MNCVYRLTVWQEEYYIVAGSVSEALEAAKRMLKKQAPVSAPERADIKVEYLGRLTEWR